ncbi:MAG: DUF2974 domain-containing protein [Atopobiaceae bacterium]|nr:DUF2974 domain-containing protein [Atopobiaceae bacterium]
MANIIDYACCELDPLTARPLGDVDSLILSWLSYYRLPEQAADARTQRGMRFSDLYDKGYLDEVTAITGNADSYRYLIAAVAASPRFRGMRICNYVEEVDPEREKQFSAMTFKFPGNITYVAFRGTDNTLVGWKEDFNLAFETEIPSQREAVEYLEHAASITRGQLWVGGHSKGGNLAVYAAVMCNDRTAKRLRAAFSHDGPGFTPEMMSREAWAKRAGLIRKTIPNQSLIGMIFEQQDDYQVVASTEQGIMQHDPFSWKIDSCSFKLVDQLSLGARHVDRSLNEWVANMTPEEREQFVDTLFSIFAASGETTFASMGDRWIETVPAMLDFANKMPEETRESFRSVIGDLFRQLAPDLSLKGIVKSFAG